MRFLTFIVIFVPFLVTKSAANESESEIYLVPIQTICGYSEEILEYIVDGEQVLAWSRSDISGNVVSLWENKNVDSFTLIKTDPSADISCIIALYESGGVSL